MTGFEAWLDRQAQASAAGIAACMSRTDLVKRRPGFGQTIVPAPGSILATPSTEEAEGEPDYFFHWTRDAALVMNAVPDLVRAGDHAADWPRLFREWVAFEAGLATLDGRTIEVADLRSRARPDFLQFVRPPEELAALHGSAIAGDVRFNPDGTLDTIRWSRPQHDGAALRALVILRCLQAGLVAPEAAGLVEADLDYTETMSGAVGVDIWEEYAAAHLDTLLVQRAALAAGGRGAAADRLAERLDGFRKPDGALFCALPPEQRKTLDIAVVLGVLHAGTADGPFTVHDPAVQATLAALEAHFAAAFPINRGRGVGIACGRYPGDRYVTGGPWYIATFAAAELRYRRAAAAGAATPRLAAEGDAILATARRTIPSSGALTEQFDPADGTQASARDLGWSHAAFLTALAARRAVTPG